MAYIQTISPWRAGGDLRSVYQEIRRDLAGRLPVPLASAVWNIMRVFSLRPDLLRAFQRCFLLSMWGDGLPRVTKEALGVSVSRANNCDC